MTFSGAIKTIKFHLKSKLGRSTFKPYVKRQSIMGISFDFVVGDIESSLWEGAKIKGPAVRTLLLKGTRSWLS